jgi:hypothetical protein
MVKRSDLPLLCSVYFDREQHLFRNITTRLFLFFFFCINMKRTVEAKNTHPAYLNMSLKYATEIHDIGTVRQIFNLNESQTAVEFH